MSAPREPRSALFGYDHENDMLWVALPGAGPEARLQIPGAWLRSKVPTVPDPAVYSTLAVSAVVFVVLAVLVTREAPFSKNESYLMGLAVLAGAYVEKIGNALARLWHERRGKARP